MKDLTKNDTVVSLDDFRARKHAEKLEKLIDKYATHGYDPVDLSFKLEPIAEYL